MPLHQDLIDELRAATRRQAEDERLIGRGVETLDAAWVDQFPEVPRPIRYHILMMYSAMYSETLRGSSRMMTRLCTIRSDQRGKIHFTTDLSSTYIFGGLG